MPTPPVTDSIERVVIDAVQWLRLGIDGVGALVLGGGVAITLAGLVVAFARRRPLDFTSLRLGLARSGRRARRCSASACRPRCSARA